MGRLVRRAAATDRGRPRERAALPRTSIRQPLRRAMRYAVLDGGKRVRPLLAYAARRSSTGADPDVVDAAAAAVELIHAYSLMHDDLPCMDDDTLRRGKPTCHVAFGEAMALLAGDALQALAFGVLAGRPARSQRRLRAARRCGRRARHGRRAGDRSRQRRRRRCRFAKLETMHRMKTGALIRAAVRLGAACGRTLEPTPRRERSIATPTRRDSRSRSSTTCSTSKARPRRSARRPARTSRRASRRSSPARACRGQGARGSAARRSAGRRSRRSARRRGASASSPTGSCCGASANSDRCNPMPTLLDSIDNPAALRRLDRELLPQLARELRSFVLTSVAQTGGHLSSNLGTIELTIALHYVFDTPHDRIVWDVGHQTYAHKILTGRRGADGPAADGGRAVGLSAPRRKANTTRSAPRTRRRRSRRRSAWRSPRSAAATTGASSR